MEKMRFLDLVRENLFPDKFTCDICGVESFGSNLCPDCTKKTPQNCGATCQICGRRTVIDGICLECKEQAPPYKRGVSAFVYEDYVIVLIAKFKNGKAYLKEFFADELVKKVALLPPFDCIVYVPMLKKAEKRRGYNQSRLLAYALSKRVGVPVIDDALVKVKENKVQKSLSAKERFKNIEGCFKVNKRDELRGKTVLVVDDILTTGATAMEMTKVLLKAGVKCVYLATVASVDYKMLKLENASDL